MSNYYINKEEKTGEVVYLDYNIKKAYSVNPKAKKKDEIEVNKIVFVSPTLTEKIIKKKIDIKINKLLQGLNTLEDDSNGDDGAGLIRNRLKESERLKLNIINNYRQYLNGNYTNLTLEKVNLIIESYRSKLFKLKEKKEKELLMELFSNMNNKEIPESKGRKGR